MWVATPKKVATKKSPAVRVVAKKATLKAAPTKAAAKKAAAKKAIRPTYPAFERPLEGDYRLAKSGLLIPKSAQTPVAPSKIRSGLLAAKEQLADMIDELVEFSGNLSVSEIELQVSFTADGKFLGVGVGGATSIKLRIIPGD
jgi:hypothetical protein